MAQATPSPGGYGDSCIDALASYLSKGGTWEQNQAPIAYSIVLVFPSSLPLFLLPHSGFLESPPK